VLERGCRYRRAAGSRALDAVSEVAVRCGQLIRPGELSFMMDIPHARPQMGSPAGVRQGLVNEKLLLQNEYLAAENRILRAHLSGRVGFVGSRTVHPR